MIILFLIIISLRGHLQSNILTRCEPNTVVMSGNIFNMVWAAITWMFYIEQDTH